MAWTILILVHHCLISPCMTVVPSQLPTDPHLLPIIPTHLPVVLLSHLPIALPLLPMVLSQPTASMRLCSVLLRQFGLQLHLSMHPCHLETDLPCQLTRPMRLHTAPSPLAISLHRPHTGLRALVGSCKADRLHADKSAVEVVIVESTPADIAHVPELGQVILSCKICLILSDATTAQHMLQVAALCMLLMQGAAQLPVHACVSFSNSAGCLGLSACTSSTRSTRAN